MSAFAADLPALWPDSDPAVLAPVEEHEDLRAVARSIVDKFGDVEQIRAALEAEQVPTEVWRRLTAELDLVAVAVPEELGGAGFGLRELVVVLEETGAALVPDPVLASAVLGVQALILAEDRAAVSPILGPVLAGASLVTHAWGAPDRLRLEPGGAAVTGTLSRVLDAAGAGQVIAPASGPDGPVLVVAELAGAGVRPLVQVDLTRSLADVTLDRAPAQVLVGPDRAPAALRRLDVLRQVAVAAEQAGMVGRLLDLTVAHVSARHQFGRPIGSFQAVKHRLADVLVARERCRSAVRYAAARFDAADIASDGDGRELEIAAAVAAAVCAEAVVAVAHEAIQLHGGIGFTWEHPAHLYLRRALGDEGLFGSARAHRARLADAIGA